MICQHLFSVEFQVKKKHPNYTTPDSLPAYVGQTLSDIYLPDGFSWINSSLSVGEIGKRTFYTKYTPKDTVRYLTDDAVPVTVDVGDMTLSSLSKLIAYAESKKKIEYSDASWTAMQLSLQTSKTTMAAPSATAE